MLDRIKNVIRWLPIIWNDRDFDSHFLLKIIIFKLENMEHHFRNHGHLENAEYNADNMKKVIETGKRILEDDYKEVRDNGIIITASKLQQNDIGSFFMSIKNSFRVWWD